MLKVAIIKSSSHSYATLERFQNHELMIDYTYHAAKQGFTEGGVILHHKGIESDKCYFERASKILNTPIEELDYVIELYDDYRE